MIANHVNQTSSGPTFRTGDERLIKLMPSAGQKVGALLTKQGRASGVLRVAVIGGGCSGLQYKMDLQDGPANRDILVETAGVKVVVDPKSALYVTGSELDFVDALQDGGFKVKNPNAATSCSCGESFSARALALSVVDYFELLGEPRRPWIDPGLLKSKFLHRSAQVHPDRVHDESPKA